MNRKEDKKELVKRAQSGDWKSFEELVDIYKDKVYSIALTLTKDRIEAEEVSHLAFLKLWRKIGKFKFKSSFSTWFYRLTHNTFYDYVRKKKRKKKSTVAIDKFYSLKSNSNPYDSVKDEEARELIKKALKEVPEKLRMVVVYYDLQGMSYKEISKVIRRPMGTVKSRLSRGREILKQELGNIMGSQHV